MELEGLCGAGGQLVGGRLCTNASKISFFKTMCHWKKLILFWCPYEEEGIFQVLLDFIFTGIKASVSITEAFLP